MSFWWVWIGLAVGGPPVAATLAVVLLWPRLPRLTRRRIRPLAEGDVILVARLLLLALSGGMPLGTSLVEVARQLEGRAATETEDLVRRSRARGLTMALAETEGLLGELCSGLVRAQITGASLRDALDSYIDRRLSASRALALQRARTIPVKLIVPVALLVLPGFILLVAGPEVLSQLTDLLGPITRP